MPASRFVLNMFYLLTFNCGLYYSQSLQKAVEGKWLIEMTHSDIGVVRTVMQFDAKDTTFAAHTRKGADKDILGGWTSFLARMFSGGFKHGSLLRIIKGRIRNINDTTRLSGILTSAIGNYYFRGYVKNGVISARLMNSKKETVGNITANKNNFQTPLEDYPALVNKAIELTGSKIYNRSLLESQEWKSFLKKMNKVTPKIQDDLEMVFAFFYYAGKLPVTHYALMKFPPSDKNEGLVAYEPQLFLEDKTKNTTYLKIKSFEGKASEVDSMFAVITKKGFKNLIVDLRENAGGNVEAGMAFASHLADSSYYGGIFLTQKWFNQHQQLPTVKEYQGFTNFSAANFGLIISGIHNTDALCLKVIPDKNVYHGKLFILIDGGTASTCEPIVYGLKRSKRATIIGEKSAGAMMNGEFFDLDKGFRMIIPTADYYASDGYKIDKKGVMPDVQVKKDQALDYTIKNLVKD